MMDTTALDRAAVIADAQYSQERFKVAYRRFTDTPALLTPNDFTVLKYLDPILAARAEQAWWTAAVIPSAVTSVAKSASTYHPTNGSRKVTWTKANMEAIADGIVCAIKSALAPILKRLTAVESRVTGGDALEERLKALENRPYPHYAGIWKGGREAYAEASLVTHGGGLWLAATTTRGTPGLPVSGWILVVKRGQA